MKVTFRADASLQIGTGHVMRCLTLADALTARGAECQFICRAHEGNLIDLIRNRGYTTHTLPVPYDASGGSTAPTQTCTAALARRHLLGTTQECDAAACAPILAAQRPDWLIVDHYALDTRWEHELSLFCGRVMVIDDLANRKHLCHLLLDQTFDRRGDDYHYLVPEYCRILAGSQYALLRPEFQKLRAYSLRRRASGHLRSLLITMGGVDADNVTGQVLHALQHVCSSINLDVTVVLGKTALHRVAVEQQAEGMSIPTRILCGVGNMAELMAEADLAIGAAGTTSWERCALGLPSLTCVLADNQLRTASALEHAGASITLSLGPALPAQLGTQLNIMRSEPDILKKMSASAARIVDGQGTHRLVNILSE